MTAIQRVLVIDDSIEVGEIVSVTIEKLGMTCTLTTDVPAFLAELGQDSSPGSTLIMLDLVMPNTDGIELLRLLAARRCQAGIILMSGVGKRVIDTAERLAKSLGLTIVGQLQKPFRIVQLEALIERVREAEPGRFSSPKMRILFEDSELRAAIDQSNFVLHNQPQIDVSSGRVVGVEALVRWKHADRGLIFPDDFIARAESLNIIDDLGWIVARQGLRDLHLFADLHGVAPMLSINVSVQSLRDLAFPDRFVTLLQHYGVSPENTILEITESGLMKEMSRTLDVLARLRIKGVQLSIDDFGTGFAVMQQLRNIPSTELKIDKSFIQNAQTSDSDWVMVQKTIEIGHELGMRVVAEGVETDQQLDFIRAFGCDVAQGYLFSRPLPLHDFVNWLDNYRIARDQ